MRLCLLVLLSLSTWCMADVDLGFEQVGSEQAPAGWIATPQYPFKSATCVQNDPRYVRTGNAALHLLTADEANGHLYSRETLPVAPGQGYDLTVHVRGKGAITAWAYLYKHDDKGNEAFGGSSALLPDPANPEGGRVHDDDWQTLRFRLELDSTQANIKSVRLVLLANGSVYVDDLLWNPPKANKPEPQAQVRVNALTAQLTGKAPVVDGELDLQRYTAVGCGLIERSDNQMYPYPATFAVTQDGQNLYLGLSMELPPGYLVDRTARSKDDASLAAAQDVFYLMLRNDTDPDASEYEGAYLAVAADGTLYDAWEKISWSKGYCHRDVAYESGCRAVTRIADGRWHLEMSVPLSKIKWTAQTEGLMSFGVNLQSRAPVWQAHPNWFDHPQAFGRLRLTSDALAVRILDLGTPSRGEVAPRVELGNSSGNSQPFEIAGHLAVPRLVGGRIGSYIFDMALDTRQKDAVADKGLWRWQDHGQVEAGGSDSRQTTHQLTEPGAYLLELEVRSGERTLSYQKLPLRYAPPITATLVPIPSRDRLIVTGHVEGARPQEKGRVRIELLAGDGKAALTHEQAIQGDQVVMDLAMADVAPGEYMARLTLIDKSGSVAAVANQPATKRPTPPWLAQRAGIDALDADWVPDPWTPVACGAAKVDVWGRRYEFAAGGLVAGLSSQQKPLLSAPMVMRYQQGTAVTSLNLDAPVTALLGKGRAQVTQRGRSAHFELDIKHTIEFDGMDRIDLVLTPKASTDVDGIWVELPLVARPFSILCANDGLASQYWQRGLVNDELFEQPRAYNVVWLGDDDIGLAFFAENYRGWRVDSRRPRVTLESDGSVRRLKLRLANAATTISEPMRITFGLHPTPFKPMYDQWRDLRPMGLGMEPPPINASFVHASLWNSADSNPAPRNWKVLEDIVTFAREQHQRVYPYLGTFFISPYDNIRRDTPFDRAQGSFSESQIHRRKSGATRQEEYFYYAEDWQVRPPRTAEPEWETRMEVRTAAGSTWSDYFAYGIEQMLIRTDVDGFYLDIANPIFDMNEQRGLSVKTLDGRTEGTMELFAARDLYKRLYRVFEKHRGPQRRPWMFGHGFAASVPYAPFWDVNFNCEEVKPGAPFEFTTMNLQRSLEGTPMATVVPGDAARNYDAFAWRAHFGQQFGLPNVVLPQYAYRADLNTVEHSREMLGWAFIHNNVLWPAYIQRHVVFEFWTRVEVPFGMGDTVFHPYWNNGVKASPQSVRVSWWDKRDGSAALLGAVNWSDQPVEAVIDLPPALQKRAMRVDPESGQSLPGGASIHLVIQPHDLRVVRLQ